MSRIKLLLDVVNGMRSLADSLEIMANEMADGDSIAESRSASSRISDEPPKFSISCEWSSKICSLVRIFILQAPYIPSYYERLFSWIRLIHHQLAQLIAHRLD